jgi:glutathione S-transferase
MYDISVENEHRHIHAMKKPVNQKIKKNQKRKKFERLGDMQKEVTEARGREEKTLCKRQRKMVKQAALLHSNKKMAQRKVARVKKSEIEEDDETRLGDSDVKEMRAEAVLITGNVNSPYVHQLQLLFAAKGIPYETAPRMMYDDGDDDESDDDDDDDDEQPNQVFAGMEVRTEREKGVMEVVTVLGKSKKHEGRWVVQVANGKAVIKKQEQFLAAKGDRKAECSIEQGLIQLPLRAEKCAWRAMLYVEDIAWKRHTTNALWPTDKTQQLLAQKLMNHLEKDFTPAFTAHVTAVSKGAQTKTRTALHAELEVVESVVANYERKAQGASKEKKGPEENAMADADDELDPSSLKVAELREELEERGLETGGKKADLVKRLTEALQATADAKAAAAAGAKKEDTAASTADTNAPDTGGEFIVGTALPCVADLALYAFVARLASGTFKQFTLPPKKYPFLAKWCAAMETNYATSAVPLSTVSIEDFREYWSAR